MGESGSGFPGNESGTAERLFHEPLSLADAGDKGFFYLPAGYMADTGRVPGPEYSRLGRQAERGEIEHGSVAEGK